MFIILVHPDLMAAIILGVWRDTFDFGLFSRVDLAQKPLAFQTPSS